MQNLIKNQTIELTITAADGNGGGIARTEDGRVIFVSGAIPGERVSALILKVGKTAAWAKAAEILSPSPERIAPECPHFPKCGGCDYLHASYTEELRQKLERVNDALARIGGISLRAENILESAREGYRNKAVFNVSPDGKVGFYRERSHDVVDIDRCLLQSDFSNKIPAVIRKWIAETGISCYNEDSGKGLIRKIFVRGSQIVIIAKGKPHNTDELRALLDAAVGTDYHLMWNENRLQANTVFGETFYRICGDEPKYELLDLRFNAAPAAFLQVNTAQAEKLYTLALDFAELAPGDKAVDLYCGVGTITLPIARKCAYVTGIEISDAATQSATANAALNGITNAEFIAGDAALTKIPDAEIIFVDPPRKGLDGAVIDAIANSSAKKVIYISCDPATLARDLKLFAESGFQACRIACVDMFPGTRHVETVVLLSRRSPDSYISVK